MAKQSFSSGQTLTAQQMNDLQTNDFNMSVTTQTANYTLQAADKGTREVANAGSAITFTVPNNVFAAGDIVDIHNINTGLLTLAAGTGMTLSSADVLTVNQWQGGTLYFTSASASIWFPRAKTVSAGGLIYLTGASFTTQTSVSLPTSTFTSTYRNYRMEFSLTAVTSDADITVRMRASGTDNTTSNYFAMWSGVNSAATAASAVSNVASSFNFGESDSTFVPYSFAIDILQPQIAAATTILGSLVYYTKTTAQVNGLSGAAWFNGTTQFDSLSVISSVASSITGAYRVYAYADS